jgi:thymidine phosphorylase
VLAVLQNAADAPPDLRSRSLALAGALLELGGAAVEGAGAARAAEVLADGRAWAKFQSICAAQGGMREPPAAPHRQPVVASRAGRIGAIDNRRLAKVAKLAGAPDDKVAGLELCARLGDSVEAGAPLFVVHAETRAELAYALAYVAANTDIVAVD